MTTTTMATMATAHTKQKKGAKENTVDRVVAVVVVSANRCARQATTQEDAKETKGSTQTVWRDRRKGVASRQNLTRGEKKKKRRKRRKDSTTSRPSPLPSFSRRLPPPLSSRSLSFPSLLPLSLSLLCQVIRLPSASHHLYQVVVEEVHVHERLYNASEHGYVVDQADGEVAHDPVNEVEHAIGT